LRSFSGTTLLPRALDIIATRPNMTGDDWTIFALLRDKRSDTAFGANVCGAVTIIFCAAVPSICAQTYGQHNAGFAHATFWGDEFAVRKV
jgi:hypothetical protein